MTGMHSRFAFKKQSAGTLLGVLAVIVLWLYLFANINNVGGAGVALPVLALFVLLAAWHFALRLCAGRLIIKTHLLLFALFMLWIAARVVLDLGSLYYLKEIMVATTGGMVLFYLVGFAARQALEPVLMQRRMRGWRALLLIVFSLLVWFLAYHFFTRVRPDLFLLKGINGHYQRAGNFLSIAFVLASCLYLSLQFPKPGSRTAGRRLCWLALWTITAGLLLVCAQLVGSNSATAVMLGTYLISVVMGFFAASPRLRAAYLVRYRRLYKARLFWRQWLKYALGTAVVFAVVLIAALVVSGFDITSIRLFGYGTDNMTSVNSRLGILLQTGAQQMGYAPWLGNMNVAYLTTGHPGGYLHSFILYIWSNLGLVGVALIAVLFFYVFKDLLTGVSRVMRGSKDMNYKYNILNLHYFFVLVFLFLFANMTVVVSWSVLWFAVGFFALPINFVPRRKTAIMSRDHYRSTEYSCGGA